MSLIDVHAHFLPPQYRDALASAGIDEPDGFPRVPMWSAQDHVGLMDRLGIGAAVLSVSSPGVQFGEGVSASDAVSLSGPVERLSREPQQRFGRQVADAAQALTSAVGR